MLERAKALVYAWRDQLQDLSVKLLVKVFKIDFGQGSGRVKILGRDYWLGRDSHVFTRDEILEPAEAAAKKVLAKFPRQTPEDGWPYSVEQFVSIIEAPTLDDIDDVLEFVAQIPLSDGDHPAIDLWIMKARALSEAQENQ